jgi:hypothetical protein
MRRGTTLVLAALLLAMVAALVIQLLIARA